VHRIVTASVDAGAALLTGGTYEGLFYRPTVLAEVPTSAPAYAEEIFGPVAPVVPFDSVDEAVRGDLPAYPF
jgi:benzaldehyde dehydrogenase (NAD)